ncbi:glycoside hydrolase family 172 protein [Paenibacillus psychroresistens]|uniref:glycoside hydrolase family 172 protein n=1 Tax=Paenibacillus psychroresistens TaxID=1778678 RepID=UPI001D043C6D|nr:glycoside hydrolase family 172 protein [Paenibacillus psychroresistens]
MSEPKGMSLTMDQMYRKQQGVSTRWVSFENPMGLKGQAAIENKGAKGRAYETIKPGETKVLCNMEGCGVINRIWMTLGVLDSNLPDGMLLPSGNVTPQILRSLRIEMIWDGAATPAVSAPVGDFFGTGLSYRVPFESALFSDPEGRSFNCYAKMPFRKRAYITITNDGDFPATVVLYYKISFSMVKSHGEDMMYFHAYWNRERRGELGRDYTVLPTVCGEGRYLGANFGVIFDSAYGSTWWGEGEIKLYLDGDDEYPTLAGTGTEDYPGSGYGLGVFNHQVQGCTYNDEGHNAFYRYHMTDPVYFDEDCKVTMQQIGSASKADIMAMKEKGVALQVAAGIQAKDNTIFHLLDDNCSVTFDDEIFAQGDYGCFYRIDDWSSTAYFYLNKSENGLPKLASLPERVANIPNKRVY